MSEKLVEKLSEWVSRRSVLERLSAGAVAMVASLFDIGLASGEVCGPNTVKFQCCCLCHPPTGSECTGCACQWQWICDTFAINNCKRWTCVECYSVGPCLGGCTNVKCSRAFYRSIVCSRP
jgi:hypothetical protein